MPTDANVTRLVALATELDYKNRKVPVTGSRTYLFRKKAVYLLYGGHGTKEDAHKAEQYNAEELGYLAEDFEHNDLEAKARNNHYYTR